MLKSRKYNANSLDKRIEIWQTTQTQSGSGAVSDVWTLLAETFASVHFPMTGQNEIVLAEGQTSVTRAYFTVRWREGIVAKMKVRHEGKDYDILSVLEEGRKAFLVLLAEKRELE